MLDNFFDDAVTAFRNGAMMAGDDFPSDDLHAYRVGYLTACSGGTPTCATHRPDVAPDSRHMADEGYMDAVEDLTAIAA